MVGPTSLIPMHSLPAGAPHAMNTTPLAPCSAPVGARRSIIVFNTAVVNVSQPFLLCDAACDAGRVSIRVMAGGSRGTYLVRSDGEARVEEQHSLPGPTRQMSITGGSGRSTSHSVNGTNHAYPCAGGVNSAISWPISL